MELNILDWFQTLHTPILDKIMTSITKLGDAGIIWIFLTILLLILPKMRKYGLAMLVGLCIDVIVCNGLLKNLVARTRPCDVNTAIQLLISHPTDYSFPSGHTAASFTAVAALYFSGDKKTLEGCDSTWNFDCLFKNVSVCTLSDGYTGWNFGWNCGWLYRLYCGEQMWYNTEQINEKNRRRTKCPVQQYWSAKKHLMTAPPSLPAMMTPAPVILHQRNSWWCTRRNSRENINL